MFLFHASGLLCWRIIHVYSPLNTVSSEICQILPVRTLGLSKLECRNKHYPFPLHKGYTHFKFSNDDKAKSCWLEGLILQSHNPKVVSRNSAQVLAPRL